MRGNALDRLLQLFYQMGYRIFLCLWFFTRPDTRGAYVAVWYRNRILIIKNSYRKILTCPSGALKRGESYLAAAVRELHEEVGIRLKNYLEGFVERQSRSFKFSVKKPFERHLTQIGIGISIAVFKKMTAIPGHKQLNLLESLNFQF